MFNIKKEILSKRHTCFVFRFDSSSSDALDYLASKLKSGINFIQLIQGNISTKEFYDISLKLKQLCSFFDAILIIQDRIDIAKLIDADGIFLDKNSFDISCAKKILDNDKIIGTDDINTYNSDYLIADKIYDNVITYTQNGAYKVIYDSK